MKLSEKGIKRFNHLYWEEDEQLHEIEFEPDDFEGMICLTVDEAKDILWDLKLLKSFVQQICPGEESEVKERIAQFESRIKQAEDKG